jgi:hypothetical protein
VATRDNPFGGKECNDEKNQANYLLFLSGLNKTLSQATGSK